MPPTVGGQGQYVGDCPMLVAHGWNVDYSALAVWSRLLVLLLRGVESVISERWGCRARCWVSEGTAEWLCLQCRPQ